MISDGRSGSRSICLSVPQKQLSELENLFGVGVIHTAQQFWMLNK
jgi:hypothetical protein